MKNNCTIDLVFICKNRDAFQEEVDLELYHLFQKQDLYWYLHSKKEGQLEIVVAEVRGAGMWKNEEDLFGLIEQEATPEFWEWLQGYRIQVQPNERECGIVYA
jgi:hypothetical protein